MVKFVDKTRTGIPGHPKLKDVVNSHAWGDRAAVERGYCKGVEYPLGKGHAKGLDGQTWLPQHGDHRPNADYNDTKEPFLRAMSKNQGQDGHSYKHSWRAPTKPGSDDYKVGYRDSDPLRQGGGGNAPRGKKNA